jgi:hypothetical protein
MTKTDAWILAAIGSAAIALQKPISLHDLVSSADYLNRLIPSAAEVDEAVNHLAKAGLVRVQDRRFCVTSDAEVWLNRFGWASGRDVISVWMNLAEAWDGQALPLTDPTFEFRLKTGELEGAVAAHHRHFQKWLAKHEPGLGGDRGRRDR